LAAITANPPRLIRYQRLVAIIAAIGIKTDLASFNQGKLIDADHPAYEPLWSRARKEFPESLVNGVERCGSDLRSQLREILRKLLEYRVKPESALSCTCRATEASGLCLYAFETAETLNRLIRSHTGIVDDLPAGLINPTERTSRSISLPEITATLAPTYTKSICTDGVR